MGNNGSNNSETRKDLISQLGTVLVTGGAGFIGSHVVDHLLSENLEVKVLDNLSTGDSSFLSRHVNNKRLSLLYKDLDDPNAIRETLEGVKTVFHLAAYPEVRTGGEAPDIPYNSNTRNTFYLLEQVRKSRVEKFLFSSSSTVYGDPNKIPTPENYGPLIPISPYGASKLAGEALVSSYCYTYGIKGQIFRLGNVVGSRSTTHGVMWDFIKKLQNNNKRLEIRGNGRQLKSYIHVLDCIECFLFCLINVQKPIEIFNVGSEDTLDVISIARIICNTMNLKNVELAPQVGWIGDVKHMHLDISKLNNLGWKPRFSSIDAVTLASKELINNLDLNDSKGE